MKRARDIRDQLLGLIDRCEIELLSNPQDVGALLRLCVRDAAGCAGWAAATASVLLPAFLNSSTWQRSLHPARLQLRLVLWVLALPRPPSIIFLCF